MAEKPYLYEVGPDLVHGTHLNISQVFEEHDHLFHTTPSVEYPYRFPRVFGDKFGDEFGDSLNFASKLVTHLVMISVNHCIW